MLLSAFVIVLLCAILATLVHPLASIVRTLPSHPQDLLATIDTAKMLLSDFLFWVIFATGLFMVTRVLWDRLRSPTPRVPQLGLGLAPGAPLQKAVAITAYNEAEAIEDVVQGFVRQPGVVEVIVVDNNSSDDTSTLALAAGAVVVNEPSQGYGFACLRGLRSALEMTDADVIVLVEGDGTFRAEDLEKFDAYLLQAHMVIGNRVTHALVEEGSQMDSFFSWGNMFAGWLLRLRHWDARFLGKANISDVGCTYRAIHRKPLQHVMDLMDVGGDHFSPHMIGTVLHNGFAVVEIPVTFQRRKGESKGASQSLRKGVGVGLIMIWHMLVDRPRTKPSS